MTITNEIIEIAKQGMFSKFVTIVFICSLLFLGCCLIYVGISKLNSQKQDSLHKEKNG
jgi:hypothetical protein